MIDPVRYPTGEFVWNAAEFPRRKLEWIAQIAELPAQLRNALRGLGDRQLETPYREGGWTPRQIVHHLADSHMQSFFRIKLALTESNPVVKPYEQDAFAALPDSTQAPIELSLELLTVLHVRWVMLFKALSGGQFQREFNHPDYGAISIARALSHYAWHGRQHTAHIAGLRERKGW
ncbi:MAG: putative metal-dependent hydrolase [Planctomycetes bacterium]|jgi:hypothetical protein|nr:putative metal-dependent hydrolase [Planctomycetota bacterium]